MSDNSKVTVITENFNLDCKETLIDLSVAANQSVGVHALNSYLPPGQLVYAYLYVYDAVESAGSTLTLSIGTDDITTEPDNIIDDLAETSIDADGDTYTGIPVIGTAATHIALTSSSQLAYEIKTEAATAGLLGLRTIVIPFTR